MNRLPFLVLALLLHACAAVPPHATEPPLENIPIARPGDYSHAPSRFNFPAAVAEFRRVTLVQRGADGLRITAGYTAGPPECLVALTLWVDPASGAASDAEKLDAAFARVKAEVGELHPGAALEKEQSGDDAPLPHRRADYLVEGVRLDAVAFLVEHDWLLRYRVVYPARCTEEADQKVKRFFDAWRR